MNRWKEELDNHPIHGTVQSILTLLKMAERKRFNEAVPELRRILKVIKEIEVTLRGLDPELIHPNWIRMLNELLAGQNIKGQIAEYNEDGDVGHLLAANNEITSNVLSHIVQLKSLSKRTAGRAKDVEDLHDSAAEKITEMLRQIETMMEELRKRETQMENDYAERVKEQEVRDDEYAKLREAQLKDLGENISKEISDIEDLLAKEHREFNTTLEEYLNTANEQRSRIQELYEITAGDSEAAGYMNNASKEQSKARRWQTIFYYVIGLSVFWITIMVGDPLLIFSYPDSVEQESQWVQFLKTFSVTGLLGFGAIYAASQANSHRRAEEYNRNKAIDVKAFDPFIASLPEDDKKELKKLATIAFFLSREMGSDPSKKGFSKSENESALGKLLKEYLTKYILRSNSADN